MKSHIFHIDDILFVTQQIFCCVTFNVTCMFYQSLFLSLKLLNIDLNLMLHWSYKTMFKLKGKLTFTYTSSKLRLNFSLQRTEHQGIFSLIQTIF